MFGETYLPIRRADVFSLSIVAGFRCGIVGHLASNVGRNETGVGYMSALQIETSIVIGSAVFGRGRRSCHFSWSNVLRLSMGTPSIVRRKIMGPVSMMSMSAVMVLAVRMVVDYFMGWQVRDSLWMVSNMRMIKARTR